MERPQAWWPQTARSPCCSNRWRSTAPGARSTSESTRWRRIRKRSSGPFSQRRLEIRAAELTTSDVGDAPILPELLDQIPPDREIATVTADGAFDTRQCHDAIAARGAAALAIGLEPMAPRWLAPAPQERQTLEARHRRGARHCPRSNGGQCLTPQRDPAHIEACRAHHLATMERVSPPKPRRDQDALRQAPGPAPLRARVRPSDRRVPAPCRRPPTASPRSASLSRKPWDNSLRGRGNPVRHPICATEPAHMDSTTEAHAPADRRGPPHGGARVPRRRPPQLASTGPGVRASHSAAWASGEAAPCGGDNGLRQ